MYKRLLSETAIYGLGSILPRLINLGLYKLYTDQIETQDFSSFVQLYAYISIINILLSFGVETGFFRFASKEKNFKSVLDTSFWFIAFNAIIFLILSQVFLTPLSSLLGYEGYNKTYVQWFNWIAFLDALCIIPFALLRYRSRPIRYSGIKVLQATVQTILVLVLFLTSGWGLIEFLDIKEKVAYPFIANLLASFLGVILLIPELRKIGLQVSKELFRKMFKYAYPIMFAGLAFVINENFDKLIQRIMISEADAGAYGGCYKLAVFMTLFVTAYRLGIEPFFFKQSTAKNAKKVYAIVMEYFTIVAGAVVIGISANISWLKHIIISDSDYLVALNIVPIILVANLFLGLYQNLSIWYKVEDKTHIGAYISWIGAGITLVLNLILLRMFGFMVSAWATLIAYGLMTVISYLWGRKYYKIPYKRNKILSFVLLAWLFSFLSFFSFNSNFWIGNLLLILYLLYAVWLEWQSLLKFRPVNRKNE